MLRRKFMQLSSYGALLGGVSGVAGGAIVKVASQSNVLSRAAQIYSTAPAHIQNLISGSNLQSGWIHHVSKAGTRINGQIQWTGMSWFQRGKEITNFTQWPMASG